MGRERVALTLIIDGSLFKYVISFVLYLLNSFQYTLKFIARVPINMDECTLTPHSLSLEN